MIGVFNGKFGCTLLYDSSVTILQCALVCAVIMFGVGAFAAKSQALRAKENSAAGYQTAVQQAKQLLTARQFKQSQVTAERAVRLDGQRYEAHIIAASALRSQKQYSGAIQHLQTALSLAPDEIRPEIQRAISEVRIGSLPLDARRKLDAVMLIIDEASKQTDSSKRNGLLREFMVQSNAFLEEYSFVPDLWLLRAEAALELGMPEQGWIAGQQLRKLGVADDPDQSVQTVLTQLERRRWLDHSFTLPTWARDVDFNAINDAAREWRLFSNEPNWNQQHDRVETYQQALKYYRVQAATGSATASTLLAFMYANGLGTAKDQSEAFRLTRKSAFLGDVRSQLWIGESYQYGFGDVKRDATQSVNWYKIAAAQKYPLAEQDLGFAYRNGEGVSRDDSEAIRWFRRSAQHAQDQGYLWIENNIAWMFATDPEPQFRDGNAAVKFAVQVCAASSYKESSWVDTLAAAYAESGDWDMAVETEQKAIDLLPTTGPDSERNLTDYRARIELFKTKRPYREKQVQVKDLYGTAIAEQQQTADEAFNKALNDARYTADSATRFNKLLALANQYPANAAVSLERQQAARAAADDLPITIASFLNSLGKMELDGSETTTKNAVEYKMEARNCSIKGTSTVWEYYKDGHYNRDIYSITVDFPIEKKYLVIELGGDGLNPSVHVDHDVLSATEFATSLRPHKNRDEITGQANYGEMPFSFLFAPGRKQEAARLRDQLSTLKDACAQQY